MSCLFNIAFTVIIKICIFCGGELTPNVYSSYYTNRSQQPQIGPALSNAKDENNITMNLYRILQQYHELKLQWYYERRRTWVTSKEGSLLFKNNIEHHYHVKKTKFMIYIWGALYSKFKSRHIDTHMRGDPLDTCDVKNCVVTNDYDYMPLADAVVIPVGSGMLPSGMGRKPSQRWVFLSDESPINLFIGYTPKFSKWANVFNWTMTYRTDSDVPIPYGRTVPLPKLSSPKDVPESITELIPYWEMKRRDVLLVILMSSCHVTQRNRYLKELQKYIKVDVYGKCFPNTGNSCPGRYMRDCPMLNKYIFYLAFENSQCRQYISEKTFYNSYAKGAIPIIMGAPTEDCEKLLPLNSYLHVDNFASPRHLSDYIRSINMNDDRLLMYHHWRRFFNVVNEHGYLSTKSQAICRLCEALNYNDDSSKVYSEDDLKLFFDVNLLCDVCGRNFY